MAILIPSSGLPPLEQTNRVYATSADLATFLGTDAPVDADRLLARASEHLDSFLALCVYDVDANGNPTVANQRNAIGLATCAQVEQWLEVGEDNLIAGYPGDTMMVRGRQISDSKRPAKFAPRAIALLYRAGIQPSVSTIVPWSEKVTW